MSSDYLVQNYARLDVEFERGKGTWLWDVNGERYLDALSGIAVCGLGHAHPEISRVIGEQAEKLVHTSNLYSIGAQKKLAEKLASISGLDQAFFCNSGTEANEAAIKFARLWSHRNGNAAPQIITAEGAFHGRTLGSLAAGDPLAGNVFGPLPAGFIQTGYDDIAAMQKALRENPQACAVMVEPIQGEGGIRVPRPGYLAALRELCDRHDALLIVDEVQTGVGRTGAWYCYQHENIRPDILTSAKALGNGVPIGACIVSNRVAECVKPGMHGSTFGGNPLACAAALAVLETIEVDALREKAAANGKYLMNQLQEKLGDYPGVTAIRSKALMLGIELDRPCGPLVGQALERGVLINVTAKRVVRLLPPLIIEREQIDMLVATLAELIPAFLAGDAQTQGGRRCSDKPRTRQATSP